jgi:sigma-B regulation protein RsbU (phosphoserine phosphatase)
MLTENDRIRICDVEFVYHATFAPKTKDPELAVDDMVVTESDGRENQDFRRLEASRSSTKASAVRPEVKLKAILEITRSLSNELRIDAVAPKILDSLLEIFPRAERLFLMMQDPSTKRLVRKAFKYRPSSVRLSFEPYPRTRSHRRSAGQSLTTAI